MEKGCAGACEMLLLRRAGYLPLSNVVCTLRAMRRRWSQQRVADQDNTAMAPQARHETKPGAGEAQAEGAAKTEAQGDASVPLIVDLDDTLVSTDLLAESYFILAKKRPLRLLCLPFWLARGRAWFKQRLAREAMPDVKTLPYHQQFLAYLKGERQRGRRLVLATGGDEAVARAVAREIGLFDAVMASDGITNLVGAAKRDRLIEEFGIRGFDYAGNSWRDRSVWEAARTAILVGASPRLQRAVAERCEVGGIFEPAESRAKAYLQALRPHHWFKGALVFVPLVLTHQLYDWALLANAVAAFAAFCLSASSIYLLNDLVDLPEDRRHPHKKERMLASGQLPIGHAIAMIPLLALGAVALALLLPPMFLAAIGFYYLLMLAYCLKLRDVRVWDASALAAGYCLRVIAGALAVGVTVSLWLLISLWLLFFGLALLKRFAEMVSVGPLQGTEGRVRAYAVEDTERIAFVGRVSSYLALLMIALYLSLEHPARVRYELIWVFWLLLTYWLARMWAMAKHGRMNSDPVAFALRDRVSRIVGVLMATTVLVAT
jgi:4-hydroxybenzoate polyprenyltransferase